MAQKNFRRQSVTGFLDLLGSKAVTPGGGSAAALTAAIGIALVEMAASINGSGSAKARTLRRRMEILIDLDAARFSRLSALYKRKEKGVVLQNALKACAEPPIKICEGAAIGVRLAKEEWPRTSRWLKSDLVEASVLLNAAFRSGLLNVEANLALIKDKKYVADTRKKIASWEKKWQKLPSS